MSLQNSPEFAGGLSSHGPLRTRPTIEPSLRLLAMLAVLPLLTHPLGLRWSGMLSALSLASLAIAFVSAQSANAGSEGDFGIYRDAWPKALIEAAGRIEASTSATLQMKDCGTHQCNWSAGDGVETHASNMPGKLVDAVIISWNNSSQDTTSRSAAKYRQFCAAMVAAIKPDWPKARVRSQADRMVDLLPTGRGARYEQKDGPVTWWASRSLPIRRDFPSEAFVQCGASANTE